MLSASDPVTWCPRRIAIAGVSGSGKTTLAKQVSELLALPYVEIDSLYHGPAWQPRTEFVSDVESFIAQESWVIEWQYASVREQIVQRADTILWLDLPTPVTLYQLTRRTLHRRLRRVPMWNGNYEGPLWRFFTDPDHIIRWGIRTRNKYRRRMPSVETQWPHVHIVRLTSRRDRDWWIDNAVGRRPHMP